VFFAPLEFVRQYIVNGWDTHTKVWRNIYINISAKGKYLLKIRPIKQAMRKVQA
jgi:hypothetical protein